MRREAGFTMIELMVALAIGAVLMTLAAVALRTYWLAQSLEGATDELVTDLREIQSDAMSQSHPLVFGASFVVGESEWTQLSYNPAPQPGEEPCEAETVTFDSGVFNAAVVIDEVNIPQDAPVPTEYTTCVTEGAIADGDSAAWFYARGTATEGYVVLEQPNTGRVERVDIGEATGRVTRS